MHLGSIVTLSALLGLGLALAQAANEELTITFGIRVVGISGLYVGQDDETLPFPILMMEYGNWSADFAQGTRYAAVSTDRTWLDVGLAYRFGTELPDSALFEDLNRDGNLELVACIAQDFDTFDLAAEVGADVSSLHDWVRADISVDTTTMVGLLELEAHFSVKYLDADFANHLYGVRPGEATGARAAYSVGETLTPRIELSAAYPFENSVELVGFFEYRRLPDSVVDSPLVADRDQTNIGLSLMREF